MNTRGLTRCRWAECSVSYPPPLRPALPLLLPLLLEVLLAGHVRVGVRVPLHGLGLVACLLQLVLEVQRLVAVDESLSAFVFRIQCIHRCVHSALGIRINTMYSFAFARVHTLGL